MKRRKVIIVCLCSIFAIVILALTVRAFAFRDFTTGLQLPPYNETDISIKQYKTGDTIKLSNEDEIKQIIDSLGLLQYAGIKMNRSSVTPEDNAYSIVISSHNYFRIFVIAQNDSYNYLLGKTFTVKLKNYDEALSVLRDLFKQD